IPAFRFVLIWLTASLADRFGRNPYEDSSKSASHIGSMIILQACCATLSLIVGIPNGRFPPFSFSIHTRLTGDGLYVRVLSSSPSFSRNLCTPYSSTSLNVMPSIPGLPSLALHLL